MSTKASDLIEPKPVSIFNFRATILSGLFVLVPLVITIFIVKLLYAWTAGIIADWIKYVFKSRFDNAFYIAVISIALLLLITYSIGIIARLVVGRKVIQLFEAIVMKIPLIKSIYSASKQVVDSISLPTNNAFKTVVLVQWPKEGHYAIAFHTGTIRCLGDKEYYKVLILPNLTTHFYQIVPPEQVIFTDIKTEDALKMVVSGGIISPEMFHESSEKDVVVAQVGVNQEAGGKGSLNL